MHVCPKKKRGGGVFAFGVRSFHVSRVDNNNNNNKLFNSIRFGGAPRDGNNTGVESLNVKIGGYF